jgi:hypothetical protein
LAIQIGVGGTEKSPAGNGAHQFRRLPKRINLQRHATFGLGFLYLKRGGRRFHAQIDAECIDVHLSNAACNKGLALFPQQHAFACSPGESFASCCSHLDGNAGRRYRFEIANAVVTDYCAALGMAGACDGPKQKE